MMSKSKFKKVRDWVWDCSELRYCPAYFARKHRLLKKSDLTIEDVEMYEKYYDQREDN